MNNIINHNLSNHSKKLALNLNEASETLSLSTSTIRRLVKRGLLFPTKATHKFIFSQIELERFLKENQM